VVGAAVVVGASVVVGAAVVVVAATVVAGGTVVGASVAGAALLADEQADSSDASTNGRPRRVKRRREEVIGVIDGCDGGGHRFDNGQFQITSDRVQNVGSSNQTVRPYFTPSSSCVA